MFKTKDGEDPSFLGYYKDAKFNNLDDLAADKFSKDISDAKRYEENTEYSTEYVYMPLFNKESEDACEYYDLYQVYCKGDGSLDYL